MARELTARNEMANYAFAEASKGKKGDQLDWDAYDFILDTFDFLVTRFVNA